MPHSPQTQPTRGIAGIAHHFLSQPQPNHLSQPPAYITAQQSCSDTVQQQLLATTLPSPKCALLLSAKNADGTLDFLTYAQYLSLQMNRLGLIHFHPTETRLTEFSRPDGNAPSASTSPPDTAILTSLPTIEPPSITSSTTDSLPDLAIRCRYLLVAVDNNCLQLLPLLLQPFSRMVVICSDDPPAIIGAYRKIKWLANNFTLRQQIWLFICPSSKSHFPPDGNTLQPKTVFNKLAQTSKRFLDIELAWAGCYVPNKHQIQQQLLFSAPNQNSLQTEQTARQLTAQLQNFHQTTV